ncbi:type VI secretion system ATPase TssH [Halioxenophilus aromaticivorans]|uniref:Type VI secretion system ATPase TssH n=1 Tax=Halioxenophilus aromaticivorans TaxID=1306992 RepID=A0AAV3U4C5_9ALTE
MQFETLVDKLDQEAKHILEQSVAEASSRSHYAVDVLHFIHKMADDENHVLHPIINDCGCNTAILANQVQTSLAQVKTGNGGFPKIAPDIVRLLFDAWILATTEYQKTELSLGFILLALLDNQALSIQALQNLPELSRIDRDRLKEHLASMDHSNADTASSSSSGQSNLAQYTVNLTDFARNGKIDSIVGRDHEVRQIIDILSRKKQNNPILTGEAGVGKTAVVEGLALKIAQGEVPSVLANVEIHTLDLGLLQAGAGVKGEFENRLKGVIKEVQNSAKPIVLFIDEAHTLIGAGQQSGAGDAANLLKPALARGELRTIAATTWAEYKQYFENDAALTRRFQVVKVPEPSVEQAIAMLRHIAPSFERHHDVIILDAAIEAAVNLSHRYISGRQLPDKCVSLLDTACARVNLSLSSTPAAIEQRQAQLSNIEQATLRLTTEMQSGYQHGAAIDGLADQAQRLQTEIKDLETQWQEEKVAVEKLLSLQSQQQTQPHCTNNNGMPPAQTIAELRSKLTTLHQDQPLLHECVTEEIIASIVSDWTGIPVGKMNKDETDNVIALQSFMEQRVIGQNHGLSLIANAIKTSRAGLADPNRPVGVFMLVGPSGVGKTETALALAEQLYGSDKLINVINMSEFKEEHKVSMLLGAPPGYVGYGQGGVLTEAVRRNPYSVLLLDEMEKAHPGVHDIFYQIFDKGMVKDGEGRDIDFKNTVILMTSNTASEEIAQLCEDIETMPAPDALLTAINPTLRKTYKPAFLGRINLIPYYPLAEAQLEKIIHLKLSAIRKRVMANYQSEINFQNNFFNWIVSQCSQSETGARQIDLILNKTVLPQLSEKILSQFYDGSTFVLIDIDVNEDNNLLINFENKSDTRALSLKAQTA